MKPSIRESIKKAQKALEIAGYVKIMSVIADNPYDKFGLLYTHEETGHDFWLNINTFEKLPESVQKTVMYTYHLAFPLFDKIDNRFVKIGTAEVIASNELDAKNQVVAMIPPEFSTYPNITVLYVEA